MLGYKEQRYGSGAKIDIQIQTCKARSERGLVRNLSIAQEPLM